MFKSVDNKPYLQKKTSTNIKTQPILIEVANYLAGLTPEQLDSTLDEFKESPNCIASFLDKYSKHFTGRQGLAENLNLDALPEELIGAEISFMCCIGKGDAVKVLSYWEVEL